MKHYGDITKINGAEVEIVDVICGGSPCQDLSVAGLRKGLQHSALGSEETTRSGLYMEQIRIVKEMREHDKLEKLRSGRADEPVRCRYMVWENVTGALSSGTPKGEDFRIVLEEAAKIIERDAVIPRPPQGKWENAGLILFDHGSIAWRIHDLQFWGCPQRRRRICVLCDFDGQSAGEILFDAKCWGETEFAQTFEIKSDIGTGSGRKIRPVSKSVSGHSAQSNETQQETSRGTTDSVGETISFQERAGKPGGGKGILIQTERTGALSTLNNQNILANTEPILLESNQNHATIQTDGVSTALPASMGMGGGYVPMVLNDQGGSVMNVSENQTGALRAEEHGHQPIVYSIDQQGGKGNAAFAKDVNCTLAAESHGTPHAVCYTPLECTRLQGYPDEWVNIGEWVDSKGKKHKDADAPKYKALGNSIGLPFWQWLAERICAQYDRPTTMASLFDGIGGFPLVFQRCGCEPVWASEIEEFPIAVTKKHFPESEV